MVMKNKLFFYDIEKNREISYQELITDLNNINAIHTLLKTGDYYSIFVNIILALIYKIPITLLDGDFTEQELSRMGYSQSDVELTDQIKNKENITQESIFDLLNSGQQWKITLYTSGTTGLPKKISHGFKSLTKAVRIDSNRKKDIWGFAYNPSHIAGLQVFFQALLNGNSIIRLFNLPRGTIIKLIDDYRITNISATPTFYRLLLPPDTVLPIVKKVTFGGEKYDARLAEVLKKIFPSADMLNVYASTEIGTLLASMNEYFTVKNSDGDKIKIIDNELFVHKTVLDIPDSYENIDDWYATGDIVEIISDIPLQFKILFRKNTMINVGGYKVNPLEVEDALNSHESIAASVVYLKENSLLGNIVIADVVATRQITEREIRNYLSEKLQPFKIPRIINIVDKLEISRTGKLKRS